MGNKFILGIGLNLFDTRALVLRDDGKVIAEIEKRRKKTDANKTIEILLELFESAISKIKKYKENLVGVGVALGGIINNKKGIVYWPQEDKVTCVYISLPLKDYLEKKINLPVIIENDANASAFAEYKFNFSKYRHILYLFGGIGCGIIIDRKIYHGKDGGAGEIFLNSKLPMSSFLGDFSFFRPWSFDLGMIKRAKELISMGKETTLIKRITSTGELSLKDIFEEVKNKDRLARQTIKEAGFCLGVKIAFLVNLFNPEVIIIGGGLEEAGNLFLDECVNAVKKFSFSEMRRNLKVTLSSLGRRSTSLGAALLVKENSLQK